MERDKLLEGYTPARGRKPSASIWGDKVLCVIRGGEYGPVACPVPFPLEGTRWTLEGHEGDIIAVRKVEG
jgi:hypothetical protein